MTAPDAAPALAPVAEAAPDPTPAAPRRPARWRRWVAILLVIVAALLAPLAITAKWVHDRILDTNGYVDTVAPLANEPVVTDALANRIVTELFAATDLQDRITDALPGPTDVLGPALTGSLKNLATTQTENLLESDTFESLWVQANRVAHEQVVAMFTGKGEAVDQQNDAIVLDLGVVADKVRQRLVDRGVGVLKRVEIPSDTIEVTLFQSDLVPHLQTAFDALDRLSTILPILFVITVVAALAIAPRRRRYVVGLGLGVAAMSALLSVGIDLGRRATVAQAGQASLNVDATKVVYDTLVVALRDWSWYAIVLGLFVAVVALVSSPGWIGRVAEWLRGSSPEVPPVAQWVRQYRALLSAGIAAAGLVVLVIWPTPTFLVFAVTVLIVAVLIATVVALARMQPRPPAAALEPAEPAAPAADAPAADAEPAAVAAEAPSGAGEAAGPAEAVDEGG